MGLTFPLASSPTRPIAAIAMTTKDRARSIMLTANFLGALSWMSVWLRKRQKIAITGPSMMIDNAKNDRKTVGGTSKPRRCRWTKFLEKKKTDDPI